MKWVWLLAMLMVPALVHAQCSNTNYGAGFTCVQSTVPSANGTGNLQNAALATFPANTTPGDGVLILGHMCSSLACTSMTPIANVTVTDDANDSGWQPCSSNASTANGVRFWYCWWLPVVGNAKVFTMHAVGSVGATTWAVEFSGGCNTTNCIDTNGPAFTCTGPCGVPITTQSTNVFVAALGYGGGTVLTVATGWRTAGTSVAAGSGIANSQTASGTVTPPPGWTNSGTTIQALAVGIKTFQIPPVTVPTLPVY